MEPKLWYTVDLSVPNFSLPKTQTIFRKSSIYLFLMSMKVLIDAPLEDFSNSEIWREVIKIL